ncbi:glycoside hydrolase family 88 protein [Paenibacillus sp. N4]|uniref:glycoside hydrolase family 88/105 protein n=1 Tax=Paenibacillus vietnamensis TaxID=2590547 RepID=UPI001CD07470|nr:glycoside hydrolase family 88 protein [Paenibacillus vietnamensis]MCA0757648.1 glycoside hydrolase family 88 protein [Paenibacillus vietnamensis]
MTVQGAPYFGPAESMAAQTQGGSIPHVLEVMARRYVGEHPPHGPVYRVTRENAIRKGRDHAYEFPVRSMFPDMRTGQRVYAWAKLWIEQPHDFIFALRCGGEVKLYHNGEKCFGSSPEEEAAGPGEAAPQLKVKLDLSRGWNHFVLELGVGANGGCGAAFGTGNRKNKPYHFLAPSAEREGEEGWVYTAPLDRPLERIPGSDGPETATGAEWFPAKGGDVREDGRLERLYGMKPAYTAYAWSKVANRTATSRKIKLAGTAFGPVRFLWLGVEVYASYKPGEFFFELEAPPGAGDLIVQSECDGHGWGFQLRELPPEAELAAPRKVHGYAGEWLHLGPFPPESAVEIADYLSLDTVADAGTESFFWTTVEPGAHVRPFLENELFGRWNYPLGVTMTGLLETGRLLGQGELGDYVRRHVSFATSVYAYSLWDRERFGAAGINNQLSDIDSLDDCGSFGALAILAGRGHTLKGASAAADDIAHYIMQVQDRMEDGALYRQIGVSPSMHNTMWCDDMYMSVPFLCRYAELTGDARYVDEAARQLLLYKNYLYMPERQIMSHVFDVAKGKQSRTAWGRGNGWVFFSLAVLLGVLPETHADYPKIISFYRELAEGYLRLQGKNGLWHQVLTDPESYEESSCTSMFIYGFALGVRCDWLEEPESYTRAVLSGWDGLCSRAIDKRGNLYGVCKGSSWSYSHSYYKHDLGWNLNDTHGIGIVLLAGIEAQRMKEALAGEGRRQLPGLRQAEAGSV